MGYGHEWGAPAIACCRAPASAATYRECPLQKQGDSHAGVTDVGAIHKHVLGDPPCCIQVPAVVSAGDRFRLGARVPACERFGDI